MKKLVFTIGLVLLVASVGLLGCAGKSDVTSGGSPAASSSSGSFDGKWTGSTEIEGYGTIPLVYNFKSEGNKLTGTTDGQTGPIPIANGKIKGNKITFEVTINLNGQDILVNYSGFLDGDKLNLSWPSQGGVTKVICSRG